MSGEAKDPPEEWEQKGNTYPEGTPPEGVMSHDKPDVGRAPNFVPPDPPPPPPPAPEPVVVEQAPAPLDLPPGQQP